MEEKKVWVVGHKNPDTDSICSAIAYADLKNRIDAKTYVPKRAGEINEETRYVLNTFGVDTPELIQDVGAQVKDIEIRKTPGINAKCSMKNAWEMMKKQNVVTLPVVNSHGRLSGVITTGDVAMSYMDIYDNNILARAKTKYRSIIETLDGTLLVGDAEDFFDEGNVMVGSANPEIMEEFINERDLVIMGNRYEAQLCAIEMNVSCIIITGTPKVSRSIQKLAEEKNVVIIATPYDTYTAARLINQSMPIDYFMKRDGLISFELDEYIDDVREVMSKERHRDFPILDENSRYCGMISRRNLLNMQKKQLILVDHNEKTQAVDGIDEADILEIIDHHRIGSLETLSPVFFRNQPLGCSATIVYKMYRESQVEIPKTIAALLCSAIISDTLMYRSPTCTPEDQKAAEDLAQIAGLDIESHAMAMFQAGSDFRSKSEEEIFYQDFKKFELGDTDFGVGQLSAMTQKELDEVKQRLLPYLNQAMADRKISMVFVMLTNIMEERTDVICAGEGADAVVTEAYHVEKEEDRFRLDGVVSRKKQLIPAFMEVLQGQ
ncbi:MAG: putative manganese-dependent inorganic diphosphatase [Lachnospiraceae bacterium]|jgi:manganese-dependent inorganic pyrophosphatase|nr:putative manganese-dependent inorganic diphosphatase [Lachnospiraceae bacterium]MCI1657217.1 putative manganese-dependent inorganic diphosphatase [Lachnospiraceae bacterium]MCI2195746.1 putative manganese-dependent inorganic diphosphatase [Lachnospiraceae bacterium]